MHSLSYILDLMETVEGWFSRQEGELLFRTAISALERFGSEASVVELGSYCGRSTVVLGHAIKASKTRAKVFAIDPHEGEFTINTGASVWQGSTLEKFKDTIAKAEIGPFVELIQKRSVDVIWDGSVSLLFIDALHTYENVSQDFGHYAPWVKKGGYVAFHDYGSAFPGIPRFVDEILATKEYRKVDLVDVLVVIEKI